MDFKEWLNLRYKIDAASRSSKIESLFLNGLNSQHRTIVDLGAGTGSNFRYYHEKLPATHQHWYLIDRGHDLLEETLINLEKGGMKLDHREGNTIHLSKEEKSYCLELTIADIFSKEVDPFLKKANIIVSNAFFDLASKPQLQTFFKKINPQQRFIATINYVGMSFAPSSGDDLQWIEKYEQHMQRTRPEGQSSGPHCMRHMKEILQNLSINFQHHESHWELMPDDPVCEGIFDFMKNAFEDMKEDIAAFEKWKSEKANVLMKVLHEDILI